MRYDHAIENWAIFEDWTIQIGSLSPAELAEIG